jgi:hypothetical protein
MADKTHFLNKLNITCYRHSNSCHNLGIDVGIFGADMDPSLSLKGIIDTAKFHHDKPINKNLTVYTSYLIRTVLTAILLFGTRTTKVLEINVSPYLNEHRTEIKEGCYPESPNSMMIRLGKFFDTLTKLKKTIKISESIVVKFPRPIEKADDIECFIYKKAASNKKHELYFVGLYSDYLKNDISSFIRKKLEDTISKPRNAIDKVAVGDIFKFISWIKDGEDCYNRDLSNSDIIVVSHSYTMSKFVKEHASNNAKYDHFLYENCSSFKIKKPFGEKMKIVTKRGIKSPDIKLWQKYEKTHRNISLCGKYRTRKTRKV